jgi:N-methylhydantoinase A
MSGWHRSHRRSLTLTAPFEGAALSAAFVELEGQAREAAPVDTRSGVLRLERLADMRYRRQTHHVAVEVPLALGTSEQIDSEALLAAFERRYEQVHGPGTGYAAAGIEIVGLRVIASTPLHLPKAGGMAGTSDGAGRSGSPRARRAWVGGSSESVPVLDAQDLAPGRELTGPVLIDLATTTVVIHPGQSGTVDAHTDIELRWAT